jgi:hypothetical protein
MSQIATIVPTAAISERWEAVFCQDDVSVTS